MADFDPDSPLPLLRRDLKIFQGPDEPDGSPTFSIFDPLRAQYFRIAWGESEIIRLSYPGISLNKLIDRLKNESTLKTNPEEVLQFFNMAHRLNLLEQTKDSETIIKEKKAATHSIWQKILFNYLYFRIPVLNPDQFLAKTLKYVRPLVSWPAILIYCFLSLIGLYFLLTQLDSYINTFSYFFNLEGLLIYGSALFGVKLIHEFSHAYTAKFYRLHVPTMGFAIILLYPVMYTDVTDGWKLKNRKHRMAISMAGVLSELIVAGLSTLGWALTEPGMLHSAFFVLSSITILSSLLMNLNPMMRFDGYYFLSDLWGIDNLQGRSFEVARWKLREWLLGLKMPPPEDNLYPERIYGMVLFSIATWIYRLFLYTAIALFVYFQFTKSLGIFLFIIEVIVFFIWPVLWEYTALKERWKYFERNPRAYATFTILGLIALWLIVPLPHTLTFPAIVIAHQEQQIYSPIEGEILSIKVQRGDTVQKDQLLMEVVDPLLDNERKIVEIKMNASQAEYNLAMKKEETRPLLSEKKAEIATFEQKLREVNQKLSSGKITAPFDGVISMWDDTLKPGRFIAKDTGFGKISTLHQLEVLSFIPERDVGAFQEGTEVSFHITLPPETLTGIVTRLNPNRLKQLKYEALASIYQGDIPTVQDPKTGQIKILPTYYPILIDLKQDPLQPRIGQTGTIRVVGPWRSLAWEGLKTVLNLFWRESGF